jgi:pyrroline-5-carboxylate reductase
VPIGYIEGVLGNIKVLRVMPNHPIRVKEGMFCISLGRYVPKGGEGLHYLTDPFYLMGDVLIVEERMMNAATAVSGSGPGFFYALVSGKDLTYAKRFAKKEFFPALYKAAEAVGFSKLDARQLARVTTEGSLKYLEKSGLDAERLKEQVASKGGTTEAGLEVLNKGGSLEEAVKAALRRAQDLAKRS